MVHGANRSRRAAHIARLIHCAVYQDIRHRFDTFSSCGFHPIFRTRIATDFSGIALNRPGWVDNLPSFRVARLFARDVHTRRGRHLACPALAPYSCLACRRRDVSWRPGLVITTSSIAHHEVKTLIDMMKAGWCLRRRATGSASLPHTDAVHHRRDAGAGIVISHRRLG